LKISGFTFVRNANIFGYPLKESLYSLLPLCDEIVIAAGKSDDDTIEYIRSFNEPKFKIIETEWDSSLRSGGRIYAQQTNLALAECKGDWCIYLQADEVFHEQDQTKIISSIEVANKNKKAESLLFDYIHFYGSYDYIGSGRQWYRQEIRAIRNTGLVTSWKDAQGFRKINGDQYSKLQAIRTGVPVYHYGWVRPPKVQSIKMRNASTYYNENSKFDLNDDPDNEFDYQSSFSLARFNGDHPAIMREKIEKDRQWTSRFDPNKLHHKPMLHKLSDGLESITGWRVAEYKNFIEIK
jgi:glycosyltransferase involved in cell wall biosynthesis